MAARRGGRSLTNPRYPVNAQLSPEILQPAVDGLLALRKMELKEIHRLIMTPHRCLSRGCVSSPKTLGSGGSDAEHKVIDKITGSSQAGTKIQQVFSLDDIGGDELGGFCKSCWNRTFTVPRPITRYLYLFVYVPYLATVVRFSSLFLGR